MTSCCNTFSVDVATIVLAFHIWSKTIILLRETEKPEAKQDTFCPSSGLCLRHPFLVHIWAREARMPSPMSSLLCPRPEFSTATGRPPSAVLEKLRSSAGRGPQPGLIPEPQLGRALAMHSPGRFALRPDATEPSDPTQPTRPLTALPAAPAQRQLCLPAAGWSSPGLAGTCWRRWAPYNGPCLPTQSRRWWPSSQGEPWSGSRMVTWRVTN